MALKDYVTGTTNKILIGTGGIGLIITAIVGLSGRTTAYQTRDSSGQNTWEVTVDGTMTMSGSIATKNLISCDTIDSTSTGMLICGTDASGGGTGGGDWSGTGALQTAFDTRYVNTSGDTMTGDLVIRATLTGSHLYAGTFSGAGLTTCSDATASKLLWNATTRTFSCGTDQNTTGTFVNTGAILNAANDRFVNVGGDTMTGALTIDLTTGTRGLNVVETASGAHIHAEKELTNSGTFVNEGTGLFNGILSLNNLLSFIGYSASPQLTAGDSTTGIHFDGPGIISLHNGGTQTMILSSTNKVGIGDGAPTEKLEVVGTISGSVLYGKNSVRSSGSLVWEGAASGASLYVATSLQGVGLTDCDSATQTLAWDATTGRFSCGTDSDTTYTAGRGLGLNGTSFSLNATITGSLVNFTTVSGSVVKGLNSVNSSGTLVFEGAASGSSLYLGTSLKGAGLVSDCDTAGTSKLLWDATTGRFSCGKDADTNTTYTAGQGLTLTSTSFKTNATLSGTLLKFQTVSGSTVFGTRSVRSSGSLIAEGNISGATLNIGGAVRGGSLIILSGNSSVLGNISFGSANTPKTKVEVYGTLSGSILRGTTLSGNIIKTGLYSPSPATVELIPTGTGTAITTGSGRIRYVVPKTMSGFKLYDAQFTVDAAGTTNATGLQIRNLNKGSRRLFSTVISVDSAEKTSDTAATPFVISTANSDVSGGDYLYIDYTAVSTTPPKGGISSFTSITLDNMYTAKSVGKKVENGALHITVEYTDNGDKPTFQETYWANSGVDPYWLQNRVNNKLHELNTLMVLHDDFQLGEVPTGHATPPPNETTLYVQEVNKLENMKKAVSLGLLDSQDPEFVKQDKRVKKEWKKEYLNSIKF